MWLCHLTRRPTVRDWGRPRARLAGPASAVPAAGAGGAGVRPGRRWAVPDPARLADCIRLRAVQMVAPQGFGYLGQALSSAEQVAALFAVARPGVDRIVCSPGHYVIGLYAAAAEVGLLPGAALASYGQDGSALEAIGTERTPVDGLTCAGRSARDCPRRRASPCPTGCAAGTPGRSRWSATASWRRARSGRRRCSPRTTGWPRLIVLLDANNSQVDGPVDGGHHDRAHRGQVGRVRLGRGRSGRARRRRGHRSRWAARPARRDRPAVLICRTSTGTAWTACRRTPTAISSSCPRSWPQRPSRARPAGSGRPMREPPYPTALKPYGQALVRARAGPQRGRLPERRPHPPVRGRPVRRRIPGPVHPVRHGRGEHDRCRRRAGPLRPHPVRAHVRRLRHPPPAGPDHQRHRLPGAAGPDHRVHARHLEPWRAEPPGHRRCRADAGGPRDDRPRRGGRGRGAPGLRRHRRPARAGLRPAEARRGTADLRR